MTYRELLTELQKMTDEQLDCMLTVEGGPYGIPEGECIEAELRICNENHSILDDGHPVIYIAK